MKAIRKTMIEAAALLVVALVLAAAANAKRESGSIKWTKNYFDTGAALVVAKAGDGPQADASDVEEPSGTNHDPAPSVAEPVDTDPQDADVEEAEAESHLEHPFQEIAFEEVVEVFNDPQTAVALNVFVDARNDTSFESGHIPGALQCDPYNVEPYLDEVLARAMGAAKVIVYCSGGDCEDSIFMCRELIEAGVPYEAIYLYPGGWKQWKAKDMPVEEGRR